MPYTSEDFEKAHALCKNKSVAIFGAGASGVAVKNFLSGLEIDSVFYAEKDSKKSLFESSEKTFEFDESACARHALVVYSPAFRPDNKWILLAKSKGLETICEPDFSSFFWKGKIVAVTGTNGKTTLTKFLTHTLNCAGIRAISAGNIGAPLCEFQKNFSTFPSDIAVMELSSFQSMRLKYLRPDALLWTNFAPDHLDWHKDEREYFEAKFELVKALEGDAFFAGNSVKNAAEKFGISLPPFTKILDESSVKEGEYPHPFDTKIQGKNFALAKMFFEIFSKKVSKEILLESAKTFSLPEHRFGEFEEFEKVKFYDDSKATNTHAAMAALDEMQSEENLVWLGGGKNKFCELSALVEKIRARAKGAVLIGETAKALKERLSDELPLGVSVEESMEDAVQKSFSMLEKSGGSVLFSPAFSSFGMFSGYAQRGKSFKNAVLCLKNSNKR